MTERLPVDEAAFPDLGLLREGALGRLLAVLNGDGEETRVVGGAVRNILLGLPAADVDLATTALPQEVGERASRVGFKPVPTGIEHGTVTVVVEDRTFEVTTLRADVETDGRHAKVTFGRSFAEDALRRDFTINALYATCEGRVIDYVGGLADLQARRVRFIGDASLRVREDYLRILRFFRFHAAYGEGALDRAGFDAAIRERDGLARLSRERIRAELVKLVVTRGAGDMVAAMSEAGLLGPLLGGIAMPPRFSRLAALARARGEGQDAILLVAGLAVLVEEDAWRLRDHLRLSNDETNRLVEAARALASLHGRAHPPAEAQLTELLFLAGRRAACDSLALAHADRAAAADAGDWTGAANYLEHQPRPRLPVTGAHIIAQGIASGPSVGAVLKKLQAAWIRSGFPQEPEKLSRLLREAIQAHTKAFS